MTKKIFLMFLSIFLSVTYLSAQVVLTVDVPTAGGLANAIGSNLKTVTDLTLTGTINATDFQTIKQMTALKNLDMSGVNVVEKGIPNNAFENRILNSLILPEGLEFLGNSSFKGSNILQGLTLPSGIKNIQSWVFENSNTKVDLTNTRNSLEIIYAGAFSNYIGSETLDFSEFPSSLNLSNVGTLGVFSNYSGHVIFPKKMDNVPSYAFCNFKGRVDLPQGLKSLMQGSFQGAEMKELILPEGIEFLGNSSFKGLKIASGLVLPSTIKNIQSYVFDSSPTKVDFSNIKNSIEIIYAGAFNNYIGSETLDFSEFPSSLNLSNVGTLGVFSNYSGHVIFPKKMDNVPSYAFCNFKGRVDLPQGLKSLMQGSFQGAEMKELILPEGIEFLGNSSFKGLKIASGLVLPSTIKNIQSYVFDSSPTKVDFSNIKNSIEIIYAGAFNNYIGSETLDFSEFPSSLNLSNVGTLGVFSNYSGHVIFPKKMDNVPSYTFCNFKGTIDLLQGLKTIGNGAFKSSTITSIELPSSVTSIGSNAFLNAVKLSKIISNNPTPPTLGSNVFAGVNKITTVLEVPKESLNLYATADQWKDFLNVNATIPKELNIQYIQYRHDNGKTDVVDYHAVRIGEYYWIDKNFHHDIPYQKILPPLNSGVERNYPMTQEYINTYMPKAGLDPKDYQVDINDFSYYYGIYYCWVSTIYMEQYGKIYENGEVDSRWGLASEGDALQLVAMADSYNEPYNDGNTVAAGLGAQLGANPLAFDIDSRPGAPEGYKTGWFTLAQAHTGSSRDLHFNLMPGGARLNGNSPWYNNVPDPTTGGTTHYGTTGDIYHLFYAAGFWLKGQKAIYIDDLVRIYGSPYTDTPWHWFNVRYTRRLTDEELGYKLYKNDEKEDIVKLGLNDTPPVGYTELEPGYLRGYYVKYIINGEDPNMTPADLYYKVKYYTNRYKTQSDLVVTRSVDSNNLVVPFKTDATVTLYPNPLQDVLNISGDNVEKVSIYDMTGRQVTTAKNSNTISVSDLKTGTYIVKVLTANGESTHKVMKK